MHRFPHPLYVSFSSLAREKKTALFRIQQKSEWAFGVFEFQDGSLLQSFWAYPCHRLCWRSSLKTGSWLGLIIHSPTVWWSHTLRGDRWIDAALWQRSVPSQNDTLTSPYSSFSKQRHTAINTFAYSFCGHPYPDQKIHILNLTQLICEAMTVKV